MRELERLLGRKTMEVEILKEALDLARGKHRGTVSPCEGLLSGHDDDDRPAVAQVALCSAVRGSSTSRSRLSPGKGVAAVCVKPSEE